MFTAVPPSRMEGAMRAWNGIADRNPVDFDEFLEGLRRPCPLRMEQRKAADAVIDAINRKPVWPSCRNPLERYGYGTLVVGMPLLFAGSTQGMGRSEGRRCDRPGLHGRLEFDRFSQFSPRLGTRAHARAAQVSCLNLPCSSDAARVVAPLAGGHVAMRACRGRRSREENAGPVRAAPVDRVADRRGRRRHQHGRRPGRRGIHSGRRGGR